MGNIDNSISLQEAAARRGVNKIRITQQVTKDGLGIRKVDRGQYALCEDETSFSRYRKNKEISDQERLKYETAVRERLDLINLIENLPSFRLILINYWPLFIFFWNLMISEIHYA